MMIEDKKIILEREDDYEFISLIKHIVNTKYGNMKINIRNGKPYQIVETEKSKLLSRDFEEE